MTGIGETNDVKTSAFYANHFRHTPATSLLLSSDSQSSLPFNIRTSMYKTMIVFRCVKSKCFIYGGWVVQ